MSSPTYEIQAQTGGTCYAHACTRVMLHCWRRVAYARLPSYHDLVTLVIGTFGSSGANTGRVLEYFGNPKDRRDNPEEFGWKIPQDRAKYLDYFDLPTLILDRFVDDETLFRKLGDQVSPREMALSFRLTDSQWESFSNFFRTDPNGILRSGDLPAARGQPDGGGHAVVLDGRNSSPGRIRIKNSWGKRWAAQGMFTIESLSTLSCFEQVIVIDVTWTLPTVGKTLRERFAQMTSKPAAGGSLHLPLLTGLEDDHIDFRPTQKLGEGGRGSVFPAVFDNIPVAVKFCSKEREKLRFEHPNIVDHIGWAPAHCDAADRSASVSFTLSTDFYLVMERADTDLQKYCQRHQGELQHAEAKKIVLDVCEGLMHLHSKRVAHCDLKPENILLVGNTWKICDFDCARMMQGSRTVTKSGTEHWTAPEVLDPSMDLKGRDLELADSYSCGVLLRFLGLTSLSEKVASVAEMCVSATASDRPKVIAISNILEFDDGRPPGELLLAAFKGTNVLEKANWSAEIPLKDWKGVRVDTDGAVTRIHLSSCGLSGSVDLTKLPKSLAQLYLRNNQLTGPVDLTKLPGSLAQLYLSTNQLSGPVDLTKLPGSLSELKLSNNPLSGPVDLTKLPKSLRKLVLVNHGQSWSIM